MSHELRTPLSAILGFSELLAYDENLTVKQVDSLRVINQSGNHLLNLINDVLEMSKIESGKHEIERSDFDLRSVLNDVYAMLNIKAVSKQLSVRLNISPEVNSGSCFRLVMPIEAATYGTLIDAEILRHPIVLSSSQPTYRIVVADDTPENRSVLVQLLTSLGFDVREVDNGRSAIAPLAKALRELVNDFCFDTILELTAP